MGYYSEFSIQVRPKQNAQQMSEIARELSKLSGYGFIGHEYEIVASEPAKWYESLDNMKELSRKYHGHSFAMLRRGENYGDNLLHLFVNGELRDQGKVAFNYFDLSIHVSTVTTQ